MIRLAHRIRHFKKLAKYTDIAFIYYASVFSWAGHIARTSEFRTASLPLAVLCWRNRIWLNACVAEFGHQWHGKKVKVWRLEQILTDMFGPYWYDEAADRNKWLDVRQLGHLKPD